MIYRKMRTSRPPPLFELQLKAGFARLAAETSVALPSAPLMARLRDYVASLLLAENLPPTANYIAMFVDKFSQLVALSQTGKPILYKKRHTMSLLFDVAALQSEMSIECPDDLVLGYTQSMMGFLLFKSDPKKIGMIGLGGGSLAKFCYRYLPGASIAVAEIDPHVIALRDDFLIPEDDARLKVHCMDGADFVRQAENQFDVLMIDGFDKTGQPPQLCSQRFYDDCYQALLPDGLMVVNLLGDVVETEIHIGRMRCSFEGAVIVIDALDSLNKIAFACKGNGLNLDAGTLHRRILQLESQHPVMLHFTALSILSERRAVPLPQLPSPQEEPV